MVKLKLLELTLDQLVWIVTHDIAIFASARLALIGIDNKVFWAAIGDGHIHEGPLQTSREAGATASSEARVFDLLLDPFGSLF